MTAAKPLPPPEETIETSDDANLSVAPVTERAVSSKENAPN
jgi:hypothetical protein